MICVRVMTDNLQSISTTQLKLTWKTNVRTKIGQIHTKNAV